MKKYTAILLVLVLTAALLAGCGCRNNKPAATVPTTMPTTAATTAPTHAATEATTAPTHTTENPNGQTDGTENATIESGNGPAAAENTEIAADNARRAPIR